MDLSMHAGVMNTIIFKVPAAAANTENTITLTGGQLSSNGDVNIRGPGAGRLIIAAGGSNRVFYINDHDDLTDSPSIISGLSLQGANESGNGGAIYSLESLTLKNVVISGNTATSGGGVYVDGTTTAGTKVSISNSLIAGNTATNYGGGLLIENLKSITISHSVVTGNSGGKEGGGVFGDIYTGGTGMAFTGCLISGNNAAIGGGLFVESTATRPTAMIVIKGTRITGNTSSSTGATGGGGLYAGVGRTVVTGSTILSNTAVYDGGGVDAVGFTSLTISSSTVTDNQTTKTNAPGQGGGGLFIQGTGSVTPQPVKIIGSSIAGNRSASYGGGLYALDGVSFTISGSNISANQAIGGGGGINANGTGANLVDLTVIGGAISDNSVNYSSGFGGGIFFGGDGIFSITGSKVAENFAAAGGGMFVTHTGSLITIKNVLAIDNVASQIGGALNIGRTDDAHVVGGLFAGNSAEDGGGISFSYATGGIAGATITGNVASATGGGVEVNNNSAVTLQIAKVFANSAPMDPDVSGPFTNV